LVLAFLFFSKRAIPLSSHGLPGYGTGGDVSGRAVVEWNCDVGDMKGQESPIFVESLGRYAQCWVNKRVTRSIRSVARRVLTLYAQWSDRIEIWCIFCQCVIVVPVRT